MSLFKRLICLMSGKHSTTVFVRNLSGDEYYEWGGGRSLWKCANCGAIEACPFRNDDKGGDKP